ncbi:hypothetical protein QUF99_22325 [Bacillus sp. DX4.1]|uniref:hypothetical protein n=1 Tax=Bacillus sp. DX4.1 TaxID=3055867 RepID=UPI0025A18B53|nr:hypothetical protein [Bacillus sp. DX4.1]MDM5189962.1 hypothetical protein [Bacillus sp. DX4.1]
MTQNIHMPRTLQKYGYDYKPFQKWEQWTLLEEPSPYIAVCEGIQIENKRKL